MLLCALNSLFDNIDAEMGRLRERVAASPTPTECTRLATVAQALEIRQAGHAYTWGGGGIW
jgi:hypothetical protein